MILHPAMDACHHATQILLPEEQAILSFTTENSFIRWTISRDLHEPNHMMINLACYLTCLSYM